MKPDTFTGFRNFDRECNNYLSDTETELTMLARYSRIQKVLIKFNTTQPSSAPVERLFSTTGQRCARRNHLSDSMFEKRLLLKANRSQLEVVVTVQINVFSFCGGTTLRYFLVLCWQCYLWCILCFRSTYCPNCYVRLWRPTELGFRFWPEKLRFFIIRRFILRPKNPGKTAVNSMNWSTNEMLKSEYFADIRGFRCKKQQVACLCVWVIWDISRCPIHGNHTA